MKNDLEIANLIVSLRNRIESSKTELRAERDTIAMRLDLALGSADRAWESFPAMLGEVHGLRTERDHFRSERDERFNEVLKLRAELAVVRDERDQLRAERDGVVVQVYNQIDLMKVVRDERDDLELHARIRALETELESRAPTEEAKRHPKVGEWVVPWAHCEPCDPPAEPAKRSHPVKVGEWVKAGCGTPGRVLEVVVRGTGRPNNVDRFYRVKTYSPMLQNWGWGSCEPCDPCDPPTASHDTPEGKASAEAVIRDSRKTGDPKPGDTVRLVRVPTADEYPLVGCYGWRKGWGDIGDERKVRFVHDSLNRRVVLLDNGFEWPLPCIEVVRTLP